MTLEVGQTAPDFSLPISEDTTISKSDFSGKKIVLYFYPRDNTPGCTKEAEAFRDAKEQFDAKNTVIIGVSKDSLKSHAKFTEKKQLNFYLGSDEDGTVCEDYDVYKEKKMYGKTFMGVVRSTFLIDENGNLQKIWPKVKVDGHVEEVLASV